MVDSFFAEYGIVIAFFIGLAGLGTFLWNIIKGYNKLQAEKEQARQKDEDTKAAIIKKDIEDRASSIKADALRQAEDVKKEVVSQQELVKKEIEMTSRILKEHTERINADLKSAIKDVNDKVMQMLSDLSERAGITNGNVKAIRTEILDLKGSYQALWDRMDQMDSMIDKLIRMTRRPSGEIIDEDPIEEQRISDLRLKKKRDLDTARRKKQQEIDDDSESQEAINKGYSDKYHGYRSD